MKTDTFTKTILAVIALALVVVGGQGTLNHITTVHAASAGQAYEYKSILRFINIDGGNGYIGVTSAWKEDASDPPNGYGNDDSGLGTRIRDLGNQGWEMFAVIPYSNFRMLNGVTTSERMVFKRKK